MRSPRRDGDRYEKHLENTPIKDWRMVRIAKDDRGAYYDLIMTGESFRRVSGSGSSAEKKGDLKSESYLAQAKRTDKKSFTVKLDDLRKSEREAMNLGKKPLFIVGFYNEDQVTDEWVLIPKWVLGEL